MRSVLLRLTVGIPGIKLERAQLPEACHNLRAEMADSSSVRGIGIESSMRR